MVALLLLVFLGLAAAGGGYYYYKNYYLPQKAQEVAQNAGLPVPGEVPPAVQTFETPVQAPPESAQTQSFEPPPAGSAPPSAAPPPAARTSGQPATSYPRGKSATTAKTPRGTPEPAQSPAVTYTPPVRETVVEPVPAPAPVERPRTVQESAPPIPPPAARPAPPPAPREGMVLWSGKLEKNGLVTFDGSSVSSGSILQGALPGVPVIVQVEPRDVAGVAEAPGPGNGWKRLVLRGRVNRAIVVTIRWNTL